MATKNDVTGDSIKSRVSSNAYKDNYDAIFGKNKNTGNSIHVSEKEYDQLSDMLDNPPEPTQALIELMSTQTEKEEKNDQTV